MRARLEEGEALTETEMQAVLVERHGEQAESEATEVKPVPAKEQP